jgi:hypothetical protein
VSFTQAEGPSNPANTTTSPGPQPGAGDTQLTGQGSTTPDVITPANDVVPTPKTIVSTNARKLAKALGVCKRERRSWRARCVKDAHKKYGKTATKAKKRPLRFQSSWWNMKRTSN